MYRILLGLALGYLGYVVIKKVGQFLGLGGQAPRPRAGREPEELVQDPICQMFIPRKEALKAQKDGKDYFFCSEGCLKRFLRGGTN
ncbi:MAG: YHS domain-containing protein [Desulfobaccales bacterium]|nr:YHS domain-containing protein [Desulfobaccales bacterium]